ncbi:MAG: LamG domain-containing protein, partial [Deltaproteobacteria bacterium]|nr:LamG domain-containing protein [Deltaproteobacteria bacterium]
QFYYRRSLDKGATWQPKILITEASGNNLITNENYRRMAVDGNNVHIFIARYRGSWYGVLTYFRSTNNGASFEAERDIVTAEVAHHIYDVYAHASKGKVVVGYQNQRNWEVVDSINVAVSNDNGANFIHRQAALFHKNNGDKHPTLYDMQVDGEKIYLVYGDAYYYYGLRWARLFFARSLDSGVSFVTNQIDVPSNEDNKPKSFADNDYHYVPKIAFAGSKVYVVFNGDDSEGKFSVFLRRSLDSGTTFQPAINLSKAELPAKNIQSGQATLAARGAKVYIVFTTTDGKVYLKRSVNSGATFDSIKELTAPESSSYSYGDTYVGGSWFPVIKLDPSDTTGSKVHVVGKSFRYVYSNNSGETFTSPIRLDVPFRSYLDRPQMSIGTDGKVHLVSDGAITWYSTGVFGDSDIFYRVFHPDVPVVSPIGNKALSLVHKNNLGDGTGDERWDTMEISSSPDLEFTTAMTVEAWVKVNRATNGEAYFVVKTDPGYGGAWVSYMLGQWRDGRVDARIATTTDGYVLVGGDPIPNNKWTHIAMTYDANGGTNNFKIYVNGKLAGQQTATGTLLTNKKGPILIGGGSSFGYNYLGLIIDELRFWNRALTQEEIQTNMRKSLTGMESGLTAYYDFNEPFNRYGTVRDITGNGNKGILLYKEQLTTGIEFALKVLKPNGGENIPAGSNYNILWQAPSTAVKFKLSYSADDKATWTEIVEVGNVRDYNWSVPAQDGRKTKSFIKVEAFDNTNQKIGEDVSDNPFIIDVLKLIEPNGGEILKQGQDYLITWQTYALTKTVAKVILQYSVDGGSTWKPIKTFTGTNPGQFNWKVPIENSVNCRVRATLQDSTASTIASDASDGLFTIAP